MHLRAEISNVFPCHWRYFSLLVWICCDIAVLCVLTAITPTLLDLCAFCMCMYVFITLVFSSVFLYVCVIGHIFAFSEILAPYLKITIWSNSRPFLSLSVSFLLCVLMCAHMCVLVLYQCFLIVSSHHFGCICPCL